MNWQKLTSLEGRTSRLPYWLASLVIMLFSLCSYIVLSLVFDLPLLPQYRYETADALVAHKQSQGILSLVNFLVIAYPSFAVMAKRLQDRGKSWIWNVLYLGPSVAFSVLSALNLATIPRHSLNGNFVGFPTLLGGLTLIALFIIGLVSIIDLGFLRGTPGPNRFGPDPLAEK